MLDPQQLAQFRRVFRHNDYHGALSVNGSPFEPFDGPFSGWEPTMIKLHAGRNELRYRTRAGSGGKWTWGFGIGRRYISPAMSRAARTISGYGTSQTVTRPHW